MSRETKLFIVTIGGILIVTILLLMFRPEFSNSINWKPFNESNIGSQIAILIFISLAIESSLEIFISNFRAVNKLDLQDRIDFLAAKNELNLEEEKELATKRKELRKYRNQTQKITSFAGLFLGFSVGLAGVRILQPFVQELNLLGWQRILFHTVDILLAAGLLSGGSSGIHRITRLYKTFTSSAQQKLNNNE
ncbi:MAG: hypothetical protein GVY04_14790 [Cyanobacteria bacterium]|jgi:uncharacterized membrane protein YcjF (UPF0283 family)|nr:hypothetical protein [Cyanobacteria bacterium GSL.Bin1]